ncbi:hypothetical protein [Varunaivibrio sulfuroxidans]|uniref:Flagellar protein FliL n=1 Tax=Varunaivibrio sulfuroxidans TaxID=1773489 RepID=A0A4R3JGD1_9PROT|nr:hypothetical protein [Varunaivibrio sulfuroxidans]TCS64266.1 hypothetical protein EDD55_102308 [Varunaivibrio sulfuroxidans]WES31296.1 hypothetical protein P3M64_02670 [Varunaivibrio sulfuroxidans]
MKKLAIAIAAVLMLSGGTISILKWMKIGPFADTTAEKSDAIKQIDNATRFIDMDPMFIPIFKDNGVAGTIQLHFKFEVNGADNEKKVRQVVRLLNNEIFKDLYAYIPRTLHNNNTLDVELIKHRLEMDAAKVLGPGVVNAALIQSMTNSGG